MTTQNKSIELTTAPKIPKSVMQTCTTLSNAGFRAWLAGGCVRDMIMLREPRDWDIATNAPAEKIRTLFPDHLEVGAAFGVFKLRNENIDIAIFRKEEKYSDHRHPDVVEVGDELTDSARRDFTVNALYYDLNEKRVIDLTGGYKDIGSKILRTVGNPMTRFSEDALRLLRAVRFAAQLNFKLERETQAALKKCNVMLKAISRERIREELYRLLESARPVMGLEAVAQSGLWEAIFGVKRVSLPADLRQLKLNWVPTPIHWICALGVTGLLGDPQTEGEQIVERLGNLIRLTNSEKRMLKQVLSVYNDSSDVPAHSPLDWIELARADKPLMDFTKSFIRRARGPTEDQKVKAVQLVDQVLRWAAKPGAEDAWPNAELLMKKEGLKGAQLGTELKTRQWQAFWEKRP